MSLKVLGTITKVPDEGRDRFLTQVSILISSRGSEALRHHLKNKNLWWVSSNNCFQLKPWSCIGLKSILKFKTFRAKWPFEIIIPGMANNIALVSPFLTLRADINNQSLDSYPLHLQLSSESFSFLSFRRPLPVSQCSYVELNLLPAMIT